MARDALRELLGQLKSARSAIQETICTDLKSCHFPEKPAQEESGSEESGGGGGGGSTLSASDVRTADLEMAVLVQVRRINCNSSIQE